jgi:NAD(P)-dependent dehydrogenase (short-subunit alcohol dehydrogenase family)
MNSIFNLNGKVALITGGGGVLGSNMAIVLAKQGVITGIMGLTLEEAEATVARVLSKALQLNLMCSTKKRSHCMENISFDIQWQAICLVHWS